MLASWAAGRAHHANTLGVFGTAEAVIPPEVALVQLGAIPLPQVPSGSGPPGQ